MNPESDANKNMLADNVQRSAERAALRNVRNFSDELENEQLSKKRTERNALILFAILAIAFALWVVFGDQPSKRAGEIIVPGHVTQPKKN